jgi:hypothetical protein
MAAIDDDLRALLLALSMKPTTLSRCCGVITGPKSFLSLSKAPTFRPSIARLSPATSLSPVSSPTATATDKAMQRSPQEP